MKETKKGECFSWDDMGMFAFIATSFILTVVLIAALALAR